MKHLLGSVLAFVGLLALPAPSRADQFFNFSYDFEGQQSRALANGILRTSDLNTTTNAYTILGITGTRTYGGETKTITGLLAPGAFKLNDNLLYAAAPFLDFNGFSYILQDGFEVNVVYNPSADGSHPDERYVESTPDVGYGTFTVTPASDVASVPEPAFVAMSSLLALGGGGLLLHRRKSPAQNAS